MDGRSRDWKPWTGEAAADLCACIASVRVAEVSRLRRFLVKVSVSERLPTEGGGKEREKDEKPAPGVGEAEAGARGLTEWFSTSWRSPRPPSSGRRAHCNYFNDINYEESGDEEGFFLPSGLTSAPHTAAANKTLESGLG